MGQVMKAAMRSSTAAPTASASRRSCERLESESTTEAPADRALQPAATELAGSGDAVLRALEGHVECDLFLRGNVVTLDGEPEAVDAAATVVRELAELIEQGHEIAPGTIAAVTGALDAAPLAGRDPRGRRLEAPLQAGRAEDRQPEALRRLDPQEHDHVRDRPGRHRQDVPRRRARRRRASRREVSRIILTRPAVEAGERLGFLPGDLMAKIDPYLRPLFDALHDMLDAEKVAAYLERGQIEVAPLAFMRGKNT